LLIVGALMGAARLKQLKDSPTSRSTIEDAIRVAVSMARTLAAVCTLTFTMATNASNNHGHGPQQELTKG